MLWLITFLAIISGCEQPELSSRGVGGSDRQRRRNQSTNRLWYFSHDSFSWKENWLGTCDHQERQLVRRKETFLRSTHLLNWLLSIYYLMIYTCIIFKSFLNQGSWRASQDSHPLFLSDGRYLWIQEMRLRPAAPQDFGDDWRRGRWSCRIFDSGGTRDWLDE